MLKVLYVRTLLKVLMLLHAYPSISGTLPSQYGGGGGGVNCCLMLGTNAMEELQYIIGQPAMSTKHSELAVVRRLVLSQTLELGPQQTRVAQMMMMM